jgi:voltage-gated potassium channel
MRLPAALRRHFLPRRHTILLGAIVLALAVRPLIADSGLAPLVFSLTLLAVLLVALLTIQVDELQGERDGLLLQRKRRNVIGWTLAALAIAERLILLVTSTRREYVAGTFVWLLFFGFVAWSQLRSVLKQRAVTSETISNAVSVYLLMGLTWGLLYVVIFLRHPEAFSFGASPPPEQQHVFPIFIYFSLTTLSTIGFGDITPLTLPARYAAVAEGIAGQFYLAILVARLVGMQMSQSVSPAPAAAAHTERER